MGVNLTIGSDTFTNNIQLQYTNKWRIVEGRGGRGGEYIIILMHIIAGKTQEPYMWIYSIKVEKKANNKLTECTLEINSREVHNKL